ncbi:hypothetical protein SDC9_184762 [bioreactor metagenome]|uniref:Uncharacterized protein n=1 Tax=bioreactor metagenome TaxID=1076179 RepID=A0A645HFA3_9ZZZZ
MDADRADGIINFELGVDKRYQKRDRDTADQTHEKCAPQSDDLTAGSDSHQSGQNAVECHGDIGLAIAQPGKKHDG